MGLRFNFFFCSLPVRSFCCCSLLACLRWWSREFLMRFHDGHHIRCMCRVCVCLHRIHIWNLRRCLCAQEEEHVTSRSKNFTKSLWVFSDYFALYPPLSLCVCARLMLLFFSLCSLLFAALLLLFIPFFFHVLVFFSLFRWIAFRSTAFS